MLFRSYEEALLDQWAFEYPRVKSVAGKYSLDQELALISRLDLLICMDSANMHFASLVGTRVLSVWGATHPYAGFYGYHQDPEDCIQLDLPCRPCSDRKSAFTIGSRKRLSGNKIKREHFPKGHTYLQYVRACKFSINPQPWGFME